MLDSVVCVFVDGEEFLFEENSMYFLKLWLGVWDIEKVDVVLLLSF